MSETDTADDRLHADRLPVGVFRLREAADGAVGVDHVSARCAAIAALDRERLRKDPSCAFDAVHPEDRRALIAAAAAARRAGQPFHWQGRLIDGDALRWVSLEATPWRTADGETVWEGVAIDVTRAKRAEQALCASVARFEALLDRLPNPILLFSRDAPHRATFANRAARERLLLPADTAAQTPTWADFAAILSAPKREALARVAPGAVRAGDAATPLSLDVGFTARSGERGAGVLFASALETEVLYALTDLTQLRSAEAALRDAQRQLEATAYNLTENIPIGTYTMVLRPGEALANFSFMSSKFLEITGLTREEAQENPLKGFACVHPDDFDVWVEKNARAFEARAPFREETRLLIDGKLSWVVAESVPRMLEDGTWIWEGVISDITAQKRAEAQLAEATRKLVESTRRESRVEERKRLLEDVHDGFGGQLAVAKLRLRHGAVSPEDAEAILADCIDDLRLVFDSMDAETAGLQGALANIRFRTEERTKRLPISVRWTLPGDDTVDLEPRAVLQFLRILQEGLSNALRHSGASAIDISVRREGTGVLLRISDDGAGFDPAAPASGRGLEHMRRRAAAEGWRLSVESGAGGTTVSLATG